MPKHKRFQKGREKFREKAWDLKKLFKAGVRIHKIAYNTNKTTYLGRTLSVIAVTSIPFLSSWTGGKVIDALVSTIKGENGTTQQLVIIISIYVGVLALERIIGAFRSYFNNTLWMELIGEITIRIQKAFSRLDLEHYNNPQYNDMLQKVKDSYGHRPTTFLNRSYYIISDVISLISSIIITVSLSPLITLILLVSIIPVFIADLIFGKVRFGIFSADAETRRRYFATREYLTDENSLMEIKIFKLKNYFINLVSSLFYKYHNREKKVEQKRNLYTGCLSILSAIGFGLVYWLIVKKVISGDITIGSFTFYIATTRSLATSMGSLLRSLSRIYEQVLYITDIFSVIDEKPKIRNGRKTLPYKGKPPSIEFRDVSFKYPHSNKFVFKNINLEMSPGENLAIVGENGAGKTTFVKLLARFHDVTSGEILIDGINIKELKLDDWYTKLSLLSQDFVRYHFDVKTNIGLGNHQNMKDMAAIIKAAKLSGAHEFINEYEYKYNQVLSKRFSKGIQPSTGQWQKIAIARALFKNPEVLILDEPTSAIDPKAEFAIFSKLFKYAKKKTIIIISHRFSTVRNASQIIVLDKGKIIEQGTHKKLIELDGKYKHAFDLQKRGDLED